MDKIRIGMCHCDVHAAWYGLLFAPADEQACFECNPSCHYYYYYRHALKLDLLPGFELTKVWDEDREKAEKLAKVFLNKPHVCGSLEEASDDVDLVFVADCSREGEYHLEYATPGLKKGVATFVDKPFAYTLADAREIVRLAEANNTPVMSSSLLRQNPYGEYFRNRFVEIGPVGEGFVKGYGLSGLGGTIHGLSLAQQIFGEGVEWVECTTGQMPVELVRTHYAPNRPDIAPDGLDVTASRTGDTVYLHVVNTRRTRAVQAQLAVEGHWITSGCVYEIAAEPELEVLPDNADVLTPVRRELAPGASLPGARTPDARWTFPAASVSAVELVVQPKG